jgi:hypothetical protein
MDLAQGALLTAIANMDGEGMSDFQKWSRRKAIQLGIIEPTEDEKAELEQAAAQPDPQTTLITAKAKDLEASAIQRTADAGLKAAQADAVGGPEAAPKVPDGLEAAHKLASVAKTAAETDHIRTQTAHLPQELAIEATNARANQLKARHSAFAGLAKLFSGGKKA